jgi:anti-sigma regulatory factor (Ser/Thr protein kinase)
MIAAMDDSERALATPALPVLELRLANRLHALEDAGPRVSRFLSERGVGERARFATELVLEEAFMNVVRHAYTDDAEHEIRLALEVEPERVRIELFDDGVAFDPTQHLPDQPAASIEHARPGGRGLPLMRRYAQRLDYTREQGGNRLVATIARH